MAFYKKEATTNLQNKDVIEFLKIAVARF